MEGIIYGREKPQLAFRSCLSSVAMWMKKFSASAALPVSFAALCEFGRYGINRPKSSRPGPSQEKILVRWILDRTELRLETYTKRSNC